MGEIAGRYADEVILTEEDDRDTPGMEILEQIARGAERSGKVRGVDLWLILDRPEAIAFAVKEARKGDVVLFLGKGNDKTIERAGGVYDYDEAGEIRGALLRFGGGG
jgi:UDP-N-acetylmuramoyl-L-alanyl-D-glutamate--2,6-diaminopimelate ligase